MATIIYTDGSVLNHGQDGPPQKGGIGAYCPSNQALKISRSMEANDELKSSNAEICAARAAVAKCHSFGITDNIIIRTDSDAVVQDMSSEKGVSVEKVSNNDPGIKQAHSFAQDGAEKYRK